MKIFKKIQSLLFPKFIDEKAASKEKTLRYKKLWIYIISLASIVSIAPLVFMTALNIYQSRKALKQEIVQPTITLTSNAKRSLELIFEERKSILNYIINEKSYKELADKDDLTNIFYYLKDSFGGFIDLGLIDSDGTQKSYAGPYDLLNKNYSDQDWFNGVKLNDFYISDVFMGFRGFPHFVIAAKHESAEKGFYALRATIDLDFINKQIRSLHLKSLSDAFLTNRLGILQTTSNNHGDIMEKISFKVPRYSPETEILEFFDETEEPGIMGYAYIEQSPFVIFINVKSPRELSQSLITLRSDLFIFLVISVILILIVTFWATTNLISQIRDANIRHDKVLHNLEYTNKMASIGRLAAGVAHEINNPLAIINQKAGLIKDIVSFDNKNPHKGKFLEIVNSILQSVDRCSTITHRLLGFAKRMDLKIVKIDLRDLIEEVIGFLGKEAIFRNIDISLDFNGECAEIESDKGQLQQIFLNIINNAFAASEEGGKITILVEDKSDSRVQVNFTDYGRGIPEKDLKHIFEPFFTTKEEGTGLGLSITYGIVKKLGGDIKVTSKEGEGTSFKVTLPKKSINY